MQYRLKLSLKASSEVGQEYAIVTFDPAVAYALVWQYSEQFIKIIVRMGVFHMLYVGCLIILSIIIFMFT